MYGRQGMQAILAGRIGGRGGMGLPAAGPCADRFRQVRVDIAERAQQPFRMANRDAGGAPRRIR